MTSWMRGGAGVVITPCKCDVMPGYTAAQQTRMRREEERSAEQTNKAADDLRSMERKLDKQPVIDTPGKILLTLD